MDLRRQMLLIMIAREVCSYLRLVGSLLLLLSLILYVWLEFMLRATIVVIHWLVL